MKIVDGWSNKTLSQLADYVNGYAFKPEHWGKEGLPIIRIEQLKKPEAIDDYFSGVLPEYNIINDGDLIFSWSASLFLRFWAHGQAALNQHLFKVIEKENVDKYFLKFFIEYYLPELVKASHGSTMQHITRKELDKFSELFPDKKIEQTQIATILSTIDQAIEQTKSIIAKQQRIKTGLMQDLLTRGIDEQGTIRSEATHEFKDSPLGRIPMEWDVSSIGNEFVVQLGKMLSKKALDGELFDYLGNRSVQWGFIDTFNLPRMHFSESERSKFSLEYGDVLICEGGEVGRTAVWMLERQDCYYQKAIHRLRPLSGKYNAFLLPYYMRHIIELGCLDGFISRTSIAHLTQEKLELVPLLVPPEREQFEILAQLEKADYLLNLELESKKKLDEIKTGLMQDLLTGKVRVTDLLNPPTQH